MSGVSIYAVRCALRGDLVDLGLGELSRGVIGGKFQGDISIFGGRRHFYLAVGSKFCCRQLSDDY